MSTFNDEMRLKLAWQTAYELRTCPDEATLYSENIDANLQKHLSICHACREKRAMDPEERKAWKTLQAQFAGATMQPATDIAKQAGQVWILAKRCGAWRDDGRFINPPSVLLLDKIPPASWKVAQLFHDKRLMGAGDVLLNGRFGFAEGWNCYSLRDDRLECCLGVVSSEEVERVLAASMISCEPAEEGSFLSFFRAAEIDVGAFVAVSAVAEWEGALQLVTVNGFLEKMLGSFADVFNKLENFIVPEVAESVFDLLIGTKVRQSTAPLAAADSNIILPVNIVDKKTDGEMSIKTICASISDDDWQDETYLIAGKLDCEPTTSLHLLASLVYNGITIAECLNQIANESPYFEIVFNNVPYEASQLQNVKFLLVKP